MVTISGFVKVIGMVRPRGCVRLNVALSLLWLCRLCSKRSLFRKSTVPPTGTSVTRGTNTQPFWSISTLGKGVAQVAPAGGLSSHITALSTPRSGPSTRFSASLSLPQMY
jgi:hypothetical protein